MITTGRHSNNGHVPVKHEATSAEPVAISAPRRGAGRLLMPALLAVTALVILRRMQRGSVA